VLFAFGVQLIAAGALAESTAAARAGGWVLVAAAALAAIGVGETLRRVATQRRSVP
jgi:Na+(H+)/acetate symporter ActP